MNKFSGIFTAGLRKRQGYEQSYVKLYYILFSLFSNNFIIIM